MINLNHIPIDGIDVLKAAIKQYSFLLGRDKVYCGDGFADIIRRYCEESPMRVAMCAMIEKYVYKITHKYDGKVVAWFNEVEA